MLRFASLFLLAFILAACSSNTGSETAESTQYDFPWYNPEISFEERLDLLIAEMTVEEKISQLSYDAAPIERLGVPEYNWWSEALHGIARSGRATVFPQPIGMGATFDRDLIHRVFTAVSDEGRAKFAIAQNLENYAQYAGLTFWTPNVNIFRDPRWGRGMETYGEDPYLTAQLGMEVVRGLQGDHPKYLKSGACAKHYVVHSGPEALRHEFDAIVSLKDLVPGELQRVHHTAPDRGVIFNNKYSFATHRAILSVNVPVTIREPLLIFYNKDLFHPEHFSTQRQLDL